MSEPNLAARLREVRARAEMSLRELAQRSGLNHNTIHKHETSQLRPTDKSLRRLANALGVSVAYLTGDDDEPGLPPAIQRAPEAAEELARCAGALDAADHELLLRVCRRLQR